MLVPLLTLTAACTGGSGTEAATTAGTPTASTVSNPQSTCTAKYDDVRAVEASRAGDLRFFGPLPVGNVGVHFTKLPDDAPVALCLVQRKGSFTVYGVPANSPAETLWVQGDGRAFQRPL